MRLNVLVLLASCLLSGCTLIGFCVGASIPRTHETEPAQAGTRPAEDSAHRRSVVAGDDTHVADVLPEPLRQTLYNSYWAAGLVVGVLVDVAVAAAVTAFVM